MLSAIFKRTAAGVTMDKVPTKGSYRPVPEENIYYADISYMIWGPKTAKVFMVYAFTTPEHRDAFAASMRGHNERNNRLLQYRSGMNESQGGITEIFRRGPKNLIAVHKLIVNKERIYVDMMSVREGWKRQGLNTMMLERFKKKWPGRRVEFSDLTREGKGFATGRGYLTPKTPEVKLILSGILSGADSSGGIEGRIVRAGDKWFFITRYAGQSFRYIFDTSAERTPEVGPAVLYGAIGTNSLAAVFQHGRAVGWFRGDQRATVRRAA